MDGRELTLSAIEPGISSDVDAKRRIGVINAVGGGQDPLGMDQSPGTGIQARSDDRDDPTRIAYRLPVVYEGLQRRIRVYSDGWVQRLHGHRSVSCGCTGSDGDEESQSHQTAHEFAQTPSPLALSNRQGSPRLSSPTRRCSCRLRESGRRADRWRRHRGS